jgi:hypothetical protein
MGRGFMTIDYSRVIQAQSDGYDVEVFKQIKLQKGFVKKEFPYKKVSGMYVHSFNPSTLPTSFANNDSHLNTLAQIAPRAVPTIWNTITNLVDVFTPIELAADRNEFSCQLAAVEYPNSWIVMAPLPGDAVVTVRNMYHEMIHWKFTALGFGKGCTPEVFDMLHHNNEFVLNPVEELHHSIVNSYDDTAQAAVGHKASGRPISASLHAYASFLGEAEVSLRFVQHDFKAHYHWLGYAKKWGDRLNESLEALMLKAHTTEKGAQLLLGLYRWTRDYQEEYKDTLKTLSKLM